MFDGRHSADKVQVLFYHSNTKVPGVFAIAEVAREGYPDCELQPRRPLGARADEIRVGMGSVRPKNMPVTPEQC